MLKILCEKGTWGPCIKGLFWHPQEPKAENCFSPICFNWFIRRITDVLNFDIYLNFTDAMVTKMADKIGLKQRNCQFWTKIKAFVDRSFKN